MSPQSHVRIREALKITEKIPDGAVAFWERSTFIIASGQMRCSLTYVCVCERGRKLKVERVGFFPSLLFSLFTEKLEVFDPERLCGLRVYVMKKRKLLRSFFVYLNFRPSYTRIDEKACLSTLCAYNAELERARGVTYTALLGIRQLRL